MRRWLITLGLGLAGCGSLRPSTSAWFDDVRWRETAALKSERARSARHLGLYRVLDSLPAQLALFPTGPSSVVLGLDSLPEPARRALEEGVAHAWSEARGGDLRLAVLFVRSPTEDSTAAEAAFWGSILPERTDGRTCVAVVARRFNWKGELARFGDQVADAIAPCVFRARFGPPGPGMERWLLETDHEGVRSADWLYRVAQSGSRFESWYVPEQGEWFVPFRLALSSLVTPYWSGPSVVGCLAGRKADCERVVMDPAVDRRGAPLATVAGVVPTEEYWYFGYAWRGTWVNHLIRTKGEPAFQRLWRSDADLASGFRAVYGQDLGDAVADWERKDWARETGDAPSVKLGATIELGTAAAGLGWSVLLLLLPLVAARRRSLP